ncbi:putative nucleotidyltransferase/HEPN domain-containing protein [Brevundimonas vesicularis]|uniref:HEPN domain-containing protein n=1 Tax=Brevundimonas vesicularis TaxID=41276 RepID=UPI00277F0E73|nr:HEPN domain-containing protein [Brevundimonas vesicularis]MDQ1193795.1 putative nucleotidyltransferase/HEPN domain-containing protein [Brevundimonas vesicularis]
MKTTLDHLPERQQQELARIRTTLLTEFEAALRKGAGGTSDWRKGGKVLKIILFGSYARTDWVDEPDNGYLSDFDLLVIVSHPKLTDIADYWWEAEDRILHDPAIGRIVNIIVHDLAEVNQALGRGEYFWTDIARDGVMLYELPGHPLAVPKPMTPRDAVNMAERYLAQWTDGITRSLETAADQITKGSAIGWRRDAAFSLHQAVERAYICFLLVHTFYFPRSHNIKFLRSLAEDVDKRLIDAWPREQRIDKRRFETLKRAYVEARYSDQYDVTVEDLGALASSARRLRDLVSETCQERILSLKTAAED